MAEKYTLVITEKPSAAKRVADALADARPVTEKAGGVSFYRLTRSGEKIVVTSAAGHLFVLDEANGSPTWTYPVFDVKWRPVHLSKKSAWSKKYNDVIAALAKNASSYVSACDYDIEGSTIAYNVMRFLCKAEVGKRMKFSTLTKSELSDSYDNASAQLDYEQIEAGLARHYLDYFWGINVSRALTLALRAAGGYKTLSTGRVQGPTLELLGVRENEIASFVPEPYWQILLTALAGKEKIDAIHNKGKFWKEEAAKQVHGKCRGQPAVVAAVRKKEYQQQPPYPFDLTTLQREAYNHFRYSPKQTLDIAQKLYEQALISYPRTSSQKLPAKIDCKQIIKALWKQKDYQKHCDQLLAAKDLKPNEGKKSDPAHPAIFPTGSLPKALDGRELKVYDLIVKRFLATFAQPAIRETHDIDIDVAGETFLATGSRTVQANWLEIYHPYGRLKEVTLPAVSKGQPLAVDQLRLDKAMTEPAKRFTQGTILKKMEELSLGTKGTRALILQTLYDRGYIRESTIEVTDLGKSVMTALEKHCPEIVSVDLTRRFEEDMVAIQEGKKKKEEVIGEAKTALDGVLKKFKAKEKDIGMELLTGVRAMLKEEKKLSIIAKCTCSGDLLTRMSKNGKRFVGCSNYPKCTITFSLPQKGKIIVTTELCDKCGLPLLRVLQYRKRPYRLCIRDGFPDQKETAAPAATIAEPETA